MRRMLVGAAAASLVLGISAPVVAAGASPIHTAATAAAATAAPAKVRAAAAGLAFSHMVPVDPQRTGFEPDVVVDSKDRIFSSVPFGFSTTESFVWSSLDHGKSYQLTPGTFGPGKPATCAGGGDTELAVDAGDNLFFSDLQGLTNLSNSVSSDQGATWNTNCAAAPNIPVDRMWYAHTPGKLGDTGFQIFEDYDATNEAVVPPGNIGGNALVETVSTDGTTFQPLINNTPDPTCTVATLNCVSSNEGLPGNQLMDPTSRDLFAVHSDSAGTGVIVSRGHLTDATHATWTHTTPLNASLCPDPNCVDPSNQDPEIIAAENFPVIAEDSAGHYYVVFSAARLNHKSNDPNEGNPTEPEQVYVVSSLDGTTWSAPVHVAGQGTNTFPWMVAGDDGRVALAWYHSDETSEQGTCGSGSGTCTNFGASLLLNAEWDVQMAQSLNAHDATPTYDIAKVTEHPIKHGQICTSGLACVSGGDRSLGDFMQIGADAQGAAVLSFVDDTSNNFSGGEAAGPSVMVRQIGGPSLKASVGTIAGPGAGPGVPVDSIADATGDANYSANGSRTPASSNLDLTGASMQVSGGELLVTINAKDLSDLTVSPSVGGPNAAWMLRWTQVDPTQPGNGHVFYAGMESDGGGAPRFFDGDMSCNIQTTHCKYFTYPGDKTIQGSFDKNGTITLHVPLPDVGNPTPGTTLFSATASSVTSATPLQSNAIFNVIDAAEPFNFTVPPPVSPNAIGFSKDRAAPGCLGTGYWTDAADGGIFTFGEASFFGSTGNITLNKPIVGMAHTPTCNGYWLVATDGGIFTFGDGQFFGSTGSMALNKPIVGMAGTPTGNGYWLVASDGGIFTFGDAKFFGSTGSMKLNKPIVGMAATPTGNGYWLVASDGGIFTFGDATFFGSAGNIKLNKPIVGMARTNDGNGYWMVATDGGIFTFGNAPFLGSQGATPLNKPIVGMAALTTADGYWLVASDGGIFTHGRAPFLGSMGGTPLSKPMVGMASH